MKSLLISTSVFLAVSAFPSPVKNDAVVMPLAGAPQLLIPVAGNTPGANGTYFRSDIAIFNLAPRDQTVQVQWLPQTGGGSPSTKILTIPAQNGIRSSDFVASMLGQSGLGSIIVTGMNSGGFEDLNAVLYVTMRVWSPEPGTLGTTSQSLPAIPTTFVGTQSAVLLAVGGADNPSNYRVNVGIVNLDPANPQKFRIAMPTPIGPELPPVEMTIPPMSMQQVGLGSGISSTQKVLIQNITGGASQSNMWMAYGSSVDNVTGDAWSELALPTTQ